jgi:hypothetical protein
MPRSFSANGDELALDARHGPDEVARLDSNRLSAFGGTDRRLDSVAAFVKPFEPPAVAHVVARQSFSMPAQRRLDELLRAATPSSPRSPTLR